MYGQFAPTNSPLLLRQFARGPINQQQSARIALNLQDQAKDLIVQSQGAQNLGFFPDSFGRQQQAQELSTYANLFATLAVKPNLFNAVDGLGYRDGRISIDEIFALSSADRQPGISSNDFQAISPTPIQPGQQFGRAVLEQIAYGFGGGYGGGYGGNYGGGYGSPGGYASGFGAPPYRTQDPYSYGFAPGSGYGGGYGGGFGGSNDNGFHFNLDINGYVNLSNQTYPSTPQYPSYPPSYY